MSEQLVIALAQLNFTVGDLEGNADKILDAARQAAADLGASLVVFPELTLTGYPPEDLLLRDEFITRTGEQLERIVANLPDITAIVGYPRRHDGHIFNSASAIRRGEIIATYDKQLLPNYAVFDEKRYFAAGRSACVIELNGMRLGITICEDVWEPGPVNRSVLAGAELVININASPYHMAKQGERASAVGERARDNGVPVVYVNTVGGQDELVFDGASFVVDAAGELAQLEAAFEEGIYAARFERIGSGIRPVAAAVNQPLSPEQPVYSALVTGVRDYVEKNGFSGAIVGLSGGVDSALTLAIASDALGPERVEAIMMPSPYTAEISLQDAQLEANALGVAYHVIPISPIVGAVEQALSPLFEGLAPDTTEENIQARVRGTLLMALSNKKGSIVLTTGNKTEMAVGYATLYGDMAGGFAVIKDVPKLLVYQLCKYRNSISAVIPQRVLDRPPSAELRPDQKDQDSLPPYDMLDAIVEMYVEEDRSAADVVAAGDFDPETVSQVISLVNRNEYKRRQAPPGVRISRRAFGRDRRYPITSGFRQRPPA